MEIEAEAAETGRRTGRKTARKPGRDAVVEVVARGEGRRSWSSDQKRRIVVEAMQPGVIAADVARRWGIGTGLLYTWRRELLATATPSPASSRAEAMAPATVHAATGRIEIAMLSGVTLRVDAGVDEAALRRVLAALEGR